MDRFSIVVGDITQSDAEAIVNAANPTLLGGGGVDGAIHAAAGPELLAECRTLGGCEPGQARLTRGYRLRSRYILHTPGFSSISTGIYGYPLPLAATVALRTIMAFLADHPIPERVRMVCHSEAAAAVYRQTWNLWYAEEKDQRL